MCMFRLLTAGELECRVGQVGQKRDGSVWASFLIYKDARVDQRVLDETIGPMCWQNSFEFINGNLYCTISILDKETGTWISKQNVGTESNTEKEKGQASDAFKRAAFNWGIGRELYQLPKIYVSLRPNEVVKRGDRLSTNLKLIISKLEYNKKGELKKLILVDKNDEVRYAFPSKEDNKKQDTNPASGQVASVPEVPVTLQIAINEAQNAPSPAEVNYVWAKYKAMYGENESFRDAIRNNPNNPKRVQ